MSAVDTESSSSALSASMPSRSRLAHNLTRACHQCECHSNRASPSPYSSPHSGSLPSPPDSPTLDPYADIDLDSISSFPSVSSSVFFSSSAGSPHFQPRNSDHEQDGLIMPSLTLPSQLPQPTAYGQLFGDASFLLTGPSGGGKTALVEFLADSDDIVDVTDWEDIDGERVLRVSTYWVEECDSHGLERYEGSENVSFTELAGFKYTDNPRRIAERILRKIHGLFNDVHSQIDNSPSSPLLHSLLASSHSPLYTALIYVIATPLTDQDREIISTLSSSIPIILFCTTSLSSALTSFLHGANTRPRLASFQPHSQLSLRTGLLRSPRTISALRAEAADRFMRWREAERAFGLVTLPTQSLEETKKHGRIGNPRSTVTEHSEEEKIERWNKQSWEAMLSEDVARRLLQIKAAEKLKSDDSSSLANSVLFGTTPCFSPVFDPLHFRSLILLSLSLLSPRPSSIRRHTRLDRREAGMDETRSTIRPAFSRSCSRNEQEKHTCTDRWRFWRWGLALFCAGIGIGCMLSTIT